MDRDILYAFFLLLVLFLTAMVVYHFLEGWDWVDSTYFAAATITTVGYGDLVPKTQTSKLFTTFFILLGIPIGFYIIFSLGKYRDHALRSRFDHLFESMASLHGPIEMRRKKEPHQREGRFVAEKVR